MLLTLVDGPLDFAEARLADPLAAFIAGQESAGIARSLCLRRKLTDRTARNGVAPARNDRVERPQHEIPAAELRVRDNQAGTGPGAARPEERSSASGAP